MDWKALIKSVAPVLGTALGGPLVGTAVKFIGEAVFGNPDMSESDLAAAIASASPEQLLKLRQSDNEFKVKMKELDVDVFRLEVSDRNSARQMAMTNMRPQIILSTIYTLGYFGCIYVVMSGDLKIPADIMTLASGLIGVMTAAQIKIMDFWFGSSYGSKEKTALMGK